MLIEPMARLFEASTKTLLLELDFEENLTSMLPVIDGSRSFVNEFLSLIYRVKGF
jgi:hypothetical protein